MFLSSGSFSKVPGFRGLPRSINNGRQASRSWRSSQILQNVQPILKPVDETPGIKNEIKYDLNSRNIGKAGLRRENSLTVRNVSLKDFDDSKLAFSQHSFESLVRGWIVLFTCSITPVVNNAEMLLGIGERILGRRIMKFIVKNTFFKHFCAGENEKEVVHVIEKLRQMSISPLLFYSAEAEPNHADSLGSSFSVAARHNCEMVKKQFEVVASFIGHEEHTRVNSGFTPIKLTALCNPIVLETITKAVGHFDKYIPRTDFSVSTSMSFKDAVSIELDAFGVNIKDQELVQFLDIIEELSAAGIRLGIKVLIDAEHSVYQPGIDFIAYHLQRHFNIDQVSFVNTFQCYLKETDDKLDNFIKLSDNDGYKLGVKLVRGAYMNFEKQLAKDKKLPSPIHDNIDNTHACYDGNVEKMMIRISTMKFVDGQKSGSPASELILGTHNKVSVVKAIDLLSLLHFDSVHKSKVHIAQLYGMGDNITHVLAIKGHNALKLLPYGPIEEVLPYLLRRAQENNTMLGSARAERQMMFAEIVRRIRTTLAQPFTRKRL